MAEEKIVFVGNVMIDTLMKHRQMAAGLDVVGKLGLAIFWTKAAKTVVGTKNVPTLRCSVIPSKLFECMGMGMGIAPFAWRNG